MGRVVAHCDIELRYGESLGYHNRWLPGTRWIFSNRLLIDLLILILVYLSSVHWLMVSGVPATLSVSGNRSGLLNTDISKL